MTDFKTQPQTYEIHITTHQLRDFVMQIYRSCEGVDSYQLEIINEKKRFSLITLLRINLFS